MRAAVLLLVMALLPAAASPLQAVAVVRSLPGGSVLVATEGAIRFHDAGGRLFRSENGPRFPRSAAVSDDGRVAVVDPVENRVIVISPHAVAEHRLPETPLAPLFSGGDLFVLSRDAAVLTAIRADGESETRPTSQGASLALAVGGRIVIYSPVTGLLERFDAATLEAAEGEAMPPGGSAIASDGNTLYLALPSAGRIAIASLAGGRPVETFAAGAVPVDIDSRRGATALTAATFHIADPAARRVWRIEGNQSMAAAFARGFLRGLIGLGVFQPGGAQFPGGVDRVVARDGSVVAHDASSGSLYRIDGSRMTAVASGIGATAFDLLEDGRIVFWDEQRRSLRFE